LTTTPSVKRLNLVQKKKIRREKKKGVDRGGKRGNEPPGEKEEAWKEGSIQGD